MVINEKRSAKKEIEKLEPENIMKKIKNKTLTKMEQENIIDKPIKNPIPMTEEAEAKANFIVVSELTNHYVKGTPLTIGDKQYRVERMNYGEYFIEPFGEERGETEGFAPGTYFLKTEDKGATFVIDFEAELEIKEKRQV